MKKVKRIICFIYGIPVILFFTAIIIITSPTIAAEYALTGKSTFPIMFIQNFLNK